MMCSLAFGKVYLDLSFINWDVASPNQNSAKDLVGIFSNWKTLKVVGNKSCKHRLQVYNMASFHFGN